LSSERREAFTSEILIAIYSLPKRSIRLITIDPPSSRDLPIYKVARVLSRNLVSNVWTACGRKVAQVQISIAIAVGEPRKRPRYSHCLTILATRMHTQVEAGYFHRERAARSRPRQPNLCKVLRS
jgi:hypothetical protein